MSRSLAHIAGGFDFTFAVAPSAVCTATNLHTMGDDFLDVERDELTRILRAGGSISTLPLARIHERTNIGDG